MKRFGVTKDKSGRARLEADERLEPADFHAVATQIAPAAHPRPQDRLRRSPPGLRPETTETRWNGKQTANTTHAGDWIVTSLSPTQEALRDRDGAVNTYVMPAERFVALYEPTAGRGEHGANFRAKGVVDAIELPGGFDILAPWGERQQAAAGYLILNGDDVYGNATATFASTYDVPQPTTTAARDRMAPSA